MATRLIATTCLKQQIRYQSMNPSHSRKKYVYPMPPGDHVRDLEKYPPGEEAPGPWPTHHGQVTRNNAVSWPWEIFARFMQFVIAGSIAGLIFYAMNKPVGPPYIPTALRVPGERFKEAILIDENEPVRLVATRNHDPYSRDNIFRERLVPARTKLTNVVYH